MRREVLLLAVLVMAGCIDYGTPESPTGASALEPGPTGSTAGAEAQTTDTTTTIPAPPSNPLEVFATRPQAEDRSVFSEFRNLRPHEERAVMCVFAGGREGEQRLYDQVYRALPADSTRTLTGRLPCGPWQTDVAIGAGDCPAVTSYTADWNSYDLELLEANLGRYWGPECEEPECRDYDVSMGAVLTGETAVDVTYQFTVRWGGQVQHVFSKTYLKGDVERTETECHVCEPTEDLRCEVCAEVVIPPEKPPVCEDFDIKLEATKTGESDTGVTYLFEVYVDGNLVATFSQVYIRGEVDRWEEECYMAEPTEGLECEVCTKVEVKKRPPEECEPPLEDCFGQNAQFRCEHLGLVTLAKDETGGETACTTATMNAVAVIVKGGTWYHVIPSVTVGDEICTCYAPTTRPGPRAWSHVEYCGCPPEE